MTRMPTMEPSAAIGCGRVEARIRTVSRQILPTAISATFSAID